MLKSLIHTFYFFLHLLCVVGYQTVKQSGNGVIFLYKNVKLASLFTYRYGYNQWAQRKFNNVADQANYLDALIIQYPEYNQLVFYAGDENQRKKFDFLVEDYEGVLSLFVSLDFESVNDRFDLELLLQSIKKFDFQNKFSNLTENFSKIQIERKDDFLKNMKEYQAHKAFAAKRIKTIVQIDCPYEFRYDFGRIDDDNERKAKKAQVLLLFKNNLEWAWSQGIKIQLDDRSRSALHKDLNHMYHVYSLKRGYTNWICGSGGFQNIRYE